ncbi:MAG: B12-binding domain-containing radical SAM protein [Nitrospirae bacterium]|nr:B12-binding domain-containing radical SAM protein [Nitrospirota bacterium]MBF0540175.1 B12-binding domain-containing radical SAM protein [Nitrospirota bacterium]
MEVNGFRLVDMNILFINLNIGATVGLNNGLAILSAVLKQRGHQTHLLFLSEDLGYGVDLKRIKGDILQINPDIIGISLPEPQFRYAEQICDGIRDYYSGFIICGGAFPTMDPFTVIRMPAVDAICIGEGEDALCELASALSSKTDYFHIKNLWVKTKDGNIIKNSLRPFKDLDELPPEDKELFDLKKILPMKNYQLEEMVGRGCPFKCSYCINDSYVDIYKENCTEPVNKKSYLRMKNIETVLIELKNTIKLHPEIKKIAFIDDSFLMFNNFLEGFSKRYASEIGLPYMCNVNPVSFNLAKGHMLKDSGCDDIRFGIESGSERVKREIMNRNISNKKVIEAFIITASLGLMTSSFNMIGLPTETKEEVMETLRLNAQILPDTIKLMTFYPFKNTPIYELCEKMDLIDHKKKRELDNYDTFTCLKFPPEHQLFLRKVQTAFSWYLNTFLNNEASEDYKTKVIEIENMDESDWLKFDFYQADKNISNKYREKNILHYSSFINRSLAAKFPSRHFS